MGYVASINGYLTLKDKTIKTNKDLVKKIRTYRDLDEDSSGFLDLMDYNEAFCVCKKDVGEGTALDIAYYDNYNEDVWREALKDIQEEVEIGSEIECSGEDGESWRWILKEDGWYEQQGHIEYDEGYKIGG